MLKTATFYLFEDQGISLLAAGYRRRIIRNK